MTPPKGKPSYLVQLRKPAESVSFSTQIVAKIYRLPVDSPFDQVHTIRESPDAKIVGIECPVSHGRVFRPEDMSHGLCFTNDKIKVSRPIQHDDLDDLDTFAGCQATCAVLLYHSLFEHCHDAAADDDKLSDDEWETIVDWQPELENPRKNDCLLLVPSPNTGVGRYRRIGYVHDWDGAFTGGCNVEKIELE